MDGSHTDGLLHQNGAFQIRGAVFEVYRAMGAGFLEAVYQECLEVEFSVLFPCFPWFLLPSFLRPKQNGPVRTPAHL